jgi:hypothetical protein
MVIDIGGGTTDIAVIALSGIVCDASIRTGGDELDQSIVQFMRKTDSLLSGEPTAERIKIRLGSAVPLMPEAEMDVKGRDLVSGLPKTVRIDSAGVRDAIQEPLSRIVNAVRRALEMTPPELASDILERGIILTGGGALIRGLDQLLIDETGLPVRVDEDPRPRSSAHRPDPRRLLPLRQRIDDLSDSRGDLGTPPRTPAVAPRIAVAGVRSLGPGPQRGRTDLPSRTCTRQIVELSDIRHSMGLSNNELRNRRRIDHRPPCHWHASGSSIGARRAGTDSGRRASLPRRTDALVPSLPSHPRRAVPGCQRPGVRAATGESDARRAQPAGGALTMSTATQILVIEDDALDRGSSASCPSGDAADPDQRGAGLEDGHGEAVEPGVRPGTARHQAARRDRPYALRAPSASRCR